MSTNSKKSIMWTTVLIILGLLALIGGAKTLVLLLPAALFVWYQARPILHGGRNLRQERQ